MTLDEWVEKNAERLRKDLGIHVKVMTNLSSDERDMLVRLLMISIRDWKENE